MQKRVAGYLHFGMAGVFVALGVYSIVSGSLGLAALDFVLVVVNVAFGVRRLKQK